MVPHQLLEGGAREHGGVVRDRDRRRLRDDRGGDGPCAVGRDGVSRPRSEHGPFEKRIGCQPVGAVHAGAGRFAHRVQARDARASVEVGDDPTHQVVRRRRHRDGLSRPVESALAHGRVDRGEALGETRGAQSRGVEADRASVLRRHGARVGAGHDVAGGELAVGVGVEGETASAVVDEHGPLAPDRLGDEEGGADREGRRVELHELEVGHRRSRADRGGDAVAGRPDGVGGVRVELSGPARGEDDGVGGEALAVGELDPADPVAFEQQVAQQGVFAEGDAGAAHRVAEGGLDGGSVASPPACSTRATAWAASSPREKSPSAARSNATPRATSSAMRAGPSPTRTSTASGSFRPAPAVRVSAACETIVSAGSVTAAMPPCAHRVFVSGRAPLVTTVTRHPASWACSAAVRPAMPLPTTTTVVISPHRSAWRRACAPAPRSRARRRRPGR